MTKADIVSQILRKKFPYNSLELCMFAVIN